MRSIVVITMFASGCLSMNTFETARTVPTGGFSHSISLTSYVNPQSEDNMPVPMPSYSFQAGVAQDFEMGVLVGMPGHLRVNAKYNPLHTEWIDAAISPGVWMGYRPHEVNGDEHALTLGGDLPLIVDLNLGPVTVVPFAGPGFVYSPLGESAGMIVRTGLGVRFPLGPHVRLHPEFSTIIDPVRGEPVDYAFGIAVGLGQNPHVM
jgi:hypothetical protein